MLDIRLQAIIPEPCEFFYQISKMGIPYLDHVLEQKDNSCCFNILSYLPLPTSQSALYP